LAFLLFWPKSHLHTLSILSTPRHPEAGVWPKDLAVAFGFAFDRIKNNTKSNRKVLREGPLRITPSKPHAEAALR
jgi:hypothetical protein